MTEINKTKTDMEIRKIVEDFCRDKYIIDSHLFPYCISVEYEAKSKESHYDFSFTIFFPREGKDIGFRIEKCGSCGMDSSIEESMKLYENSLQFLKDMAILKNKLME
jgi:hypothetical protein